MLEIRHFDNNLQWFQLKSYLRERNLSLYYFQSGSKSYFHRFGKFLPEYAIPEIIGVATPPELKLVDCMKFYRYQLLLLGVPVIDPELLMASIYYFLSRVISTLIDSLFLLTFCSSRPISKDIFLDRAISAICASINKVNNHTYCRCTDTVTLEKSLSECVDTHSQNG
jgi:hypothetical protein